MGDACKLCALITFRNADRIDRDSVTTLFDDKFIPNVFIVQMSMSPYLFRKKKS